MNPKSNMINLAIRNYMFCLLGFGIEMRHFQTDFQNIANGKYKNKKERHQSQSHFKERPKFVKTSRRGLKDDKYNVKPRDKKDTFHHHNNMQQPEVMFNPSFHKFR